MMNDGRVYLDYNATTPLAPEVLESINVALRDFWGNPSSGHDAGLKAKRCIDEARASVGKMINADASDIIFTSGGTESNNTLLYSMLPSRPTHADSHTPHIIISNLEHDSIALTAKVLHDRGAIRLTIVPARPETGTVCPDDVVLALGPDTRLVSLMLANNETGIIQPVGGVVKAVREWEGQGSQRQRVLVHTDAAQALGKIPVNAKELGVDYLTIVGHKFYGPRTGALFVRGLESKATPLVPILYGGGQERGLRSGTENTGMIAGLGKAAELIVNHVTQYECHMTQIRDYLEEELEECFGSRIHFNGKYDESQRIPNICNVSFIGKEFKGNHVLALLRRSQASVGAACHSHNTSRPSPVLVACGVAEEIAVNALRLSVGRETTKADIDVFVQDLKQAITTITMS